MQIPASSATLFIQWVDWQETETSGMRHVIMEPSEQASLETLYDSNMKYLPEFLLSANFACRFMKGGCKGFWAWNPESHVQWHRQCDFGGGGGGGVEHWTLRFG